MLQLRALIFTACFLCGFVTNSYALDASGILSTDTTWGADDSPVYVLGDVQVASGATLTIEAGVEVVFTGGYEVLVQGAVDVAGTESSRVVFRGADDLPDYPESWSSNYSGPTGLKFIGSDLSSSSVSWLSSTGLERVIKIGEETEHSQGGKNTGELLVTNLSIRDGRVITDGYGTSASLRLEDVDFERVKVRGNYPRSEPIAIVGGTVKDSLVESASYNYGISLTGVEVSGTQFSLGCCGANISLTSCEVSDSSFSDFNDSYDVTITDSLLVRTPLSLGQASKVTISGSQLVESGVSAKGLTMTGSSVIGADVGVVIQGGGYSAASSISDSLITQCGSGIVVMAQGELSVSGSNVFLNEGLNLDNRSSEAITATGNYWGHPLEDVVENSIQHGVDDLNLGLVDFSQQLDALSTIPPLSPVLVVQSVSSEEGSQNLFWSRSIEGSEVGYEVQLFESETDIVPASVFNTGSENTFLLGSEYQGMFVRVVAFEADPDTGDKLTGANVETWGTEADSVENPDWFEIFIQPELAPDGPVWNPINREASFRILSWTLPPVVRPGQEVDSSLLIEFTDDVNALESYDREDLVSLSVFGNWNSDTELERLQTSVKAGEPRMETYRFSFTAPLAAQEHNLRLASSYGSEFTDLYFGENDIEKLGPYSETSFEVVEKSDPPIAPKGLAAVGGADSIYLSWEANTEANLVGYHVYRGESESVDSMTRITSEVVQLSEFLDDGVSHLGTYFYTVTAMNLNEDESEHSEVAETTVSKIVMTIDDFVGAPGSEVSLLVSAENAIGVSGNGMDVRVTYDEDFLIPVSVERTNLTESFQVVDNVNEASGQINVSAISLDGSLIEGRGALLEVVFQVKEDAEIGSVGEHVFTDVRLYNAELSQLAVDFSDTASFTVSNKYKLGDVSGDGEIDSLDALMALQHSAGLRTIQDGSPEFRAGDVNKDGVIDTSDVVLIQKMAVEASGLSEGIVELFAERGPASTPVKTLSDATGYMVRLPAIGGRKGEMVSVPVEVSGPTGFAGIDLGIVYDPLILKLSSVERAQGLESFSLLSNYRQGSPSISIARESGENVSLSGTIELKFEVIGQPGDESPLKVVRQKIVNSAGDDVSLGAEIDHQNGMFSVLDLKIDNWLEEKLAEFSSELRAFDADPDEDSLSNLAEYAFGLEPSEYDSPRLGEMFAGDKLSLSVNMRADDSRLSIHCLVSNDLQEWLVVKLEFDEGNQLWTSSDELVELNSSSENVPGIWKLQIVSQSSEEAVFMKFEFDYSMDLPAVLLQNILHPVH